jgi:predicted enzyme related to lactoylglutathione lyase
MPSTVKGLDSIWVHIRNVKKARPFYKGALGLKELDYNEEQQYAMYKLPGGTLLGIHKQGKGEPGREAGTVSGVYFKVADVRKAAASIAKKGGKVTDKPVKKPWGDWNATIADPDGNEFCISD